MHPRIGKRSAQNGQEVKKPSHTAKFIALNTKKSITLKQEYLYLVDVKKAMNIYHLETTIHLKRWVLQNLPLDDANNKLRNTLEISIEKKRHQLQKHFKISL